MDGINSDKVNINLGEGGGGGGSMAAVIAALGNRNQGNDNAALIAALGQRNEGHRGDDGFGFGGGGGVLGLVALLGLLGKRGFGGDDCGDGNGGKFAILQTLMENGADLRAAIPTAALETQKEVCATGAQINNAINQSQLASLAAFANLKDTVQNSATVLLTSGNQNTKEILGAICGLSSKIDQNQILDLQRQLGVAQAAAAEERHHSHTKEVEFNLSQNVNQQQLQAQKQSVEDSRFDRIERSFANFGQQLRAQTAQDIINLGTMIGSAGQTSTAVNQK